MQWQGTWVQYLGFLVKPEAVLEFANSSNGHREGVISKLLQLLAAPAPKPLSCFFSSSQPRPNDQSTEESAALQLVEQTQSRALLLCILLQLSLADSFAMKWQLYIMNMPEVLLHFATVSSLHPDSDCSKVVKILRPDVHAKPVDLHSYTS